MVLIREIVQQTLETGCLTVEAEGKLRQLLTVPYDQEDLYFFMELQLAIVSGQVVQETRVLRENSTCSRD